MSWEKWGAQIPGQVRCQTNGHNTKDARVCAFVRARPSHVVFRTPEYPKGKRDGFDCLALSRLHAGRTHLPCVLDGTIDPCCVRARDRSTSIAPSTARSVPSAHHSLAS